MTGEHEKEPVAPRINDPEFIFETRISGIFQENEISDEVTIGQYTNGGVPTLPSPSFILKSLAKAQLSILIDSNGDIHDQHTRSAIYSSIEDHLSWLNAADTSGHINEDVQMLLMGEAMTFAKALFDKGYTPDDIDCREKKAPEQIGTLLEHAVRLTDIPAEKGVMGGYSQAVYTTGEEQYIISTADDTSQTTNLAQIIIYSNSSNEPDKTIFITKDFVCMNLVDIDQTKNMDDLIDQVFELTSSYDPELAKKMLEALSAPNPSLPESHIYQEYMNVATRFTNLYPEAGGKLTQIMMNFSGTDSEIDFQLTTNDELTHMNEVLQELSVDERLAGISTIRDFQHAVYETAITRGDRHERDDDTLHYVAFCELSPEGNFIIISVDDAENTTHPHMKLAHIYTKSEGIMSADEYQFCFVDNEISGTTYDIEEDSMHGIGSHKRIQERKIDVYDSRLNAVIDLLKSSEGRA